MEKIEKITIGILGGTGPMGLGVGFRLSQAGHSVLIGSRDEQRAQEVVEAKKKEFNSLNLTISGSINETAAKSDVVIVATPAEALYQTVSPLKEHLSSKLVISMVNFLTKVGREMRPVMPAYGSMALELQHILKDSQIAVAFNHMPAEELLDLNFNLDSDVAIVGSSKDAISLTSDLVRSIKGLNPVAIGSLALSYSIESFTSVLVSGSIRNKSHLSIKFRGLE